MSDELPPGQEPKETSAEKPKETPQPAGADTEDSGTDSGPHSGTDQEEARFGRRTATLIVAMAVVVLAAIGVGIYLIATSGESDVANPPQPTITGTPEPEPPSSPPPSEPPSSAPPASEAPATLAPNKNVVAARTTAEQAATAINSRDIATMRKLSCDPSTVGSAQAFPPQATARLIENPEITGDKATARLELSVSGSEPTVVPLPLERHDGKWCVP